MDAQLLRYYLDKYALGTLSEGDWEKLRDLLRSAEAVEHLEHYLDEKILEEARSAQDEPDLSGITEDVLSAVLKKIHEEKKPTTPIRRLVPWIRYAAAFFLLLAGVSTYLFFFRSEKTPENITENIEPGKEGAILTLADGSTLVLDSLENGTITIQPGSRIELRDGQIVYDSDDKKSRRVAYNTMSTPRGREFGLVLPDGTKVWLNAASSITFPTVFEGGERRVSVTGEAYFEIAENAAQPFWVTIGNSDTVQVLGTHFNVNSYRNEGRIVTTVLEGSVKVSSANQVILRAGEQAVSVPGQSLTKNAVPDLEQVMAWRSGVFYFKSADLQTVMKQLERWYDIDVTYQGRIPELKISGKMDRGLSLQEILDFLMKMDVKFTRTGRALTVHCI